MLGHGNETQQPRRRSRLLRVWHGGGQNSRIRWLATDSCSPTSDLIPPPLAFGQLIELDAVVSLLDRSFFVLEAVLGLHGTQRLHLDAAADGCHQPIAFED